MSDGLSDNPVSASDVITVQRSIYDRLVADVEWWKAEWAGVEEKLDKQELQSKELFERFQLLCKEKASLKERCGNFEDQVRRLKVGLDVYKERAAGAEYDVGLLRAEIKAWDEGKTKVPPLPMSIVALDPGVGPDGVVAFKAGWNAAARVVKSFDGYPPQYPGKLTEVSNAIFGQRPCDVRPAYSSPELIIVEESYSGYYLSDLEARMSGAELARWKEWSRGMTMALHEGRRLVYKHDWEQFNAGRPNLD